MRPYNFVQIINISLENLKTYYGVQTNYYH